MRFLSLAALSLVLVFTTASQALALDSTPSARETNKQAILDINKRRLEMLREHKASREAALKQRRVEIKEKIGTRTAEMKQAILDSREELKTIRLKNKTELERLLKAFKDQRKVQIALKIDQNLNTINERRTSHMSDRLDRMLGLVQKMETRVNEASTAGKSTSDAQTAINDAKKAITDAQSAVAAQAGQDYTVSVSDESQLKVDVKATRDDLHQDLKAVHDLVVAAKDELVDAVKVVVRLNGGTNE